MFSHVHCCWLMFRIGYSSQVSLVLFFHLCNFDKVFKANFWIFAFSVIKCCLTEKLIFGFCACIILDRLCVAISVLIHHHHHCWHHHHGSHLREDLVGWCLLPSCLATRDWKWDFDEREGGGIDGNDDLMRIAFLLMRLVNGDGGPMLRAHEI